MRSRLDESTAAMELSAAPVNEADALAAKYAAGGATVDADLAALKAEMGIAPAAGAESVDDELAAMKKELEG